MRRILGSWFGCNIRNRSCCTFCYLRDHQQKFMKRGLRNTVNTVGSKTSNGTRAEVNIEELKIRMSEKTNTGC